MIENIASEIRKKIGNRAPKIGIILGSGLGGLANEIKDSLIIPYQEIAGFPQSTVAGHQGKLIIGSLGGQEVLCLQGRFHLYEGHPPATINKVITCLKLLGIEELIITNAAGSLHEDMPAGSLMLISDHIGLNTPNPLFGPDDEKYGPRFPDMSNAYASDIRDKIKTIAQKEHIKLHEGVYFLSLGPCFETPAEIRAIKTLGGDAVGMSTVPEVICAVHCGIKVLGISVITNLGTGLKSGTQSHEETLNQAQEAAGKLQTLIKKYLESKANG